MAKSLAARVRQRIEESDYTLTVRYPVRRDGASGTSPLASAPVSPLVRAPAPTLPDTLYEERVRPDRTMPCLFTEMTALGQMRQERFRMELGSWGTGVEAVARVDKADALDAHGNSIFAGCDHVEVDDRKYKVLNVVKLASSVSRDGSYYVLLKGALRE